jgi:hypothetical protein
MDGKRRISIVIFPNCIQVISRMKHRKPGNKAGTKVFDRVLNFWFLALTAIYGWTAGPSPLSGFKAENNQKLWRLAFPCFFLDKT